MSDALLASLKDYDIENAAVSLWTYKKPSQEAGADPAFKGRWVFIDDNVKSVLKFLVRNALDGITETIPYSLLAQNNECSALRMNAAVTHAGIAIAEAVGETAEKKVKKLQELQNTVFYCIKFSFQDSLLFAFKKTDASWATKKAKDRISLLYSDDGLAINDKPGFSLSKYVDFILFDEQVFIKDKMAFESVLSYKSAHVSEFSSLKVEQEFASLFADTIALDEYVGSNKMQLRRIAAIKQKGHYKNPAFMKSLKDNYEKIGLKIVFDKSGKIAPTPETCGDIIRALLDHRLMSHYPAYVYDVQDAAQVTGAAAAGPAKSRVLATT